MCVVNLMGFGNSMLIVPSSCERGDQSMSMRRPVMPIIAAVLARDPVLPVGPIREILKGLLPEAPPVTPPPEEARIAPPISMQRNVSARPFDQTWSSKNISIISC